MGGQSKSRERNAQIILVGYNPLAAEYLRALLKCCADFEVLHYEDIPAGGPNSAESTCIFVLDSRAIRLPLPQCLRLLRSRFPEGRVLIVGPQPSVDDFCDLLFFGVHGLVDYEAVEQRFAEALRTVSAGGLWVPTQVLEHYIDYSTRLSRLRREYSVFTHREHLVIGLLQRRLSNKEIASTLGITESTVKYHLANIFAKLQVHDRYSAIDLVRMEDANQKGKTPSGHHTVSSPDYSPKN